MIIAFFYNALFFLYVAFIQLKETCDSKNYVSTKNIIIDSRITWFCYVYLLELKDNKMKKEIWYQQIQFTSAETYMCHT